MRHTGTLNQKETLTERASAILTETPANALKRVQELQKRVRAGDESCRAELQQAKANMNPKLTMD